MSKLSRLPLLIGAVILLLVLGGSWYGYTRISEAFTEKERALAEARTDIAMLEEALESLRTERDVLSAHLASEQEKNEVFSDQISQITGTVGKLDKLAQTDPELLKKYSKVYFLNEHYQPANLALLDEEYAYDETREFYLTKEVLPFFEDMIEDAKKDGIDLWVVSTFRSFETQAALKGNYTVTYGSGANAFSADQGYSEHQLGTTVDFTTTGIGGGLNGFGDTPAYQWLTENAHEYGFVLSYPPNNSYYVFEPWHWRFVGTELADDLHDDGKYFYDVDQRTLDSYLISIFD